MALDQTLQRIYRHVIDISARKKFLMDETGITPPSPFKVPSGSISPLRNRRSVPTSQNSSSRDLPIFLTSLTAKFGLFLLGLVLVLLSTIFTYWFLYFRLIPRSHFAFPAHLGADGCMHVQMSAVQWRLANSTVGVGLLPVSPATYDVSLLLTLPPSFSAQTFLDSVLFAAPSSVLATSTRSFVPLERSSAASLLRTLLWIWPETLNLVHPTKQQDILLFEVFPASLAHISGLDICFSPSLPPVHHAQVLFNQRHLSWSLQYFVAEFPVLFFLLFLAATLAAFLAVAATALFLGPSPREFQSQS